jgi:hypothetical protein
MRAFGDMYDVPNPKREVTLKVKPGSLMICISITDPIHAASPDFRWEVGIDGGATKRYESIEFQWSKVCTHAP